MRYVESDTDCADCLCRVCTRNCNNDLVNSKLGSCADDCTCDNCEFGQRLIETEDDCADYLPDEDI